MGIMLRWFSSKQWQSQGHIAVKIVSILVRVKGLNCSKGHHTIAISQRCIVEMPSSIPMSILLFPRTYLMGIPLPEKEKQERLRGHKWRTITQLPLKRIKRMANLLKENEDG